MPVVEDGGQVLVGRDGALLARFVMRSIDGRRVADRFELEPGVDMVTVVSVVVDELRGMRVAGSVELGRALIEAGGTARRHAHVYSRDLRQHPAPPAWAAPPGVGLTPVDRPSGELVDAYRSAYPPDHPDLRHLDQPQDVVGELRSIASGEMVGPILSASGLAVDTATGDVLGAILVADAPGEPPFGGPWVAELFRHRDRAPAGTGRALLERALAKATQDGLDTLGLAVTDGNRAEALYRALGFARVMTSLSVDV